MDAHFDARLGRSPSAPVMLAPLQPPSHSPFGLDWLEHEPPEFARQRYQETRRKATKLVNAAYRQAFQRLGVGIVEPPPWPPREPLEPAEDKGRRRGTLSVYKQQPVPLPRSGSAPSTSALGAGTCSSPAAASAASSGARRSPCMRSLSTEPLQAPLPLARAPLAGAGRRKETMNKVFDWGKYSHGGPYTFGQVFEEIEADVKHRPARDTRTVPGKLGPLHIGSGTTRMPRELPQLRRRHLR